MEFKIKAVRHLKKGTNEKPKKNMAYSTPQLLDQLMYKVAIAVFMDTTKDSKVTRWHTKR